MQQCKLAEYLSECSNWYHKLRYIRPAAPSTSIPTIATRTATTAAATIQLQRDVRLGCEQARVLCTALTVVCRSFECDRQLELHGVRWVLHRLSTVAPSVTTGTAAFATTVIAAVASVSC